MIQSPARPRRRVGFLSGIALIVILACMLWLVVTAAFAPWIYSVGGHLRPLPVWKGSADARTAAGNYHFTVWFTPSPAHSNAPPATRIWGGGYMCTPKGERIPLRVTGGTAQRVWRTMDGQAFQISTYRATPGHSTSADHPPPRLNFSGRWDGSNLTLSDEGSIGNSFLGDGSVNLGAGGWQPRTASSVPVVFSEISVFASGPDCAKFVR